MGIVRWSIALAIALFLIAPPDGLGNNGGNDDRPEGTEGHSGGIIQVSCFCSPPWLVPDECKEICGDDPYDTWPKALFEVPDPGNPAVQAYALSVATDEGTRPEILAFPDDLFLMLVSLGIDHPEDDMGGRQPYAYAIPPAITPGQLEEFRIAMENLRETGLEVFRERLEAARAGGEISMPEYQAGMQSYRFGIDRYKATIDIYNFSIGNMTVDPLVMSPLRGESG